MDLNKIQALDNVSHKKSENMLISYEQALNIAIKNEISFINELEYLHTLLQHPGLKGNVLSLEKCIHIISNMLIAHRNLKDELSDKTCLVSCAFFNLMPHLKIYLDYASCVERVNICIKKITVSCMGELWKRSSELLQTPVNHLLKYSDIINQLSQALPELESKPLKDILEAIEKTVLQMHIICHSTDNALKLLQIQRSLIEGQPKIFKSGRVFLKEGCLEKVKKNGHGCQERIFFLFSDILLCCKKLKYAQDWHKPLTLMCRTVIPLSTCSVHPTYTLYEGHDVFEIQWKNNSYKLFSKIEGITQSWVDELENAIKCYKQLHLEEEKKRCSSLRRNTLLRRPFQSQLQRRVSESNIPDDNLPTNDVISATTLPKSKKKSSIKESFRIFFH